MAKTNNDKEILKLQAEISKKEEKISNSSRFNPTTNCKYTIDGNNVINIHLLDINSLKLNITQLRILSDTHLKLFEEDLKLNGVDANDYINDMMSKYNALNVQNEKKKLKDLKDQLEELLSYDSKVERKLNKIKELIK